jgi:tetratricopeptide (TPR) repeat protein/glycosyltransferase involved in cell wall biosynthesis
MAPFSEVLTLAHQHYRAGRQADAENICQQLLQQNPDDATVAFQVGLALHQFGNLSQAIACYRRAIALEPDHASALNNLGIALKQCGQVDEALQAYKRALTINADYPEAYNNLGNLLRQTRQTEEAIAYYRRCIRLAPEFWDAHYNLGNALRELGHYEEAIACFQTLLEQNIQTADVYNSLGNALQGNGRYTQAIAAYQTARQLNPHDPAIDNNLGAALDASGDWDSAAAAYRRALSLRPDYADAYYNLGNTLRSLERLDEAVVCYQKSLALNPHQVLTENNLGLVLHDLGRLDEAMAAFQRAIAQTPNYADAHLNLGLSLLMAGDLRTGFEEYEWRWRVQGPGFKPPRLFEQPCWDGSSLTGQTILLYAEQGFGDTIQFIRYAPLVAQQGGRVIVECQPALAQLLQTCSGIDQIIPAGSELPNFQVHASLMSLPRIFGTTLARVPATVPYLAPLAPPAPLKNSHLPFRVGLVWAGSATHGNDRHRSCPFTQFQAICTIDGVQFYSLQVGDRAADLEQLGDRPISVIDLSSQLTDFAATAAVIAQLDLVITVDTAVAHLAGALGRPTWVMLAFDPDWRWMLHREDSPWYPTMRLFRQPAIGDWSSVIARIQTELSVWMSTRLSPAKSPLPTAPTVTPPSSALLQTLALVEHQLNAGQLMAAEQSCQDLIQQFSPHPDSLKMMGLIAYRCKRTAEAIAYFQQSLELAPDDVTLYVNLANAYLRQGKASKAIPLYRQAAHRSGNPTVYNNLGVALKAENRYAEAIAYYQQALDQHPNYADTHYNLANALRDQSRLEQAIHHYRRAVTIRPDYGDAWNNLGNVLKDQNQLEEAIACYRRAIELNPDHASAHHNLGYALLLLGNLREGFTEYEWRWQVKGFKSPRDCPQPQWDGSTLNGKAILLHTEQGFGDTIQFIRYARQVEEQGGIVIVECRKPLVRLLQGAPGVTHVIARGQPLPTFEVHSSLMSLPHILQTTLETVPSPIPYLTPSVQMRDPVQRAFRRATGLKVGIAWAGSPTHRNNVNRSCSFAYFWALLRMPGICFFSLQKGDCTADISQFCDAHWPLNDLNPYLDDFADTAAAIAHLDLVITVDTSVGHLAGALGKPVWILLPYAPDWRWMLNRSDSPWYPTARLFRQPSPGDWTTVFAQVKDALTQWVSTSAPTTNISPVVADTPRTYIGVGIELSLSTGWGVFGTNLTLQLLQRSDYLPIPLLPPLHLNDFSPLHRRLLDPLFARQQRIFKTLAETAHSISVPFLVLKALGNHFVTVDALERIRGSHTVGLIFSEDTQFTKADLAKAGAYDRIIAGSRWNAEILRQYGIQHVSTICQGIDPTLFHPAPKSGLWSDRFVVFSGGKLEFRKGQDLVVKAFRDFQTRHPDAVLLTAWHNLWPATMADLERSRYVNGTPTIDQSGRLQIKDWLVKQGIPDSACLDMGPITNSTIGQILREADVALFPNRAEGGTNLAAMESMACGIPTILSANTGHLDLIHDNHCYALRHQRPVDPTPNYQGTDGWGESDIDEIIETLETVYQNREHAQQIGQASAHFMLDWTWEKQVSRLLEAIASE